MRSTLGAIRTRDPRFNPTSAFAAAGGVRGLDCLFAVPFWFRRWPYSWKRRSRWWTLSITSLDCARTAIGSSTTGCCDF